MHRPPDSHPKNSFPAERLILDDRLSKTVGCRLTSSISIRVYTATVRLNGVFLSLPLYNLGWNRSMAIVFRFERRKKNGLERNIFYFFLWIDGRRFAFQSKSQQPNIVRLSDTIRFPNFLFYFFQNTGLCAATNLGCIIFTSGCCGGGI